MKRSVEYKRRSKDKILQTNGILSYWKICGRVAKKVCVKEPSQLFQ
jgi:hypothetical protein